MAATLFARDRRSIQEMTLVIRERLRYRRIVAEAIMRISCTSAVSPCSGCEECHIIALRSFRRRLKTRFVTMGPSQLHRVCKTCWLPDQAGLVTGSSTSRPREYLCVSPWCHPVGIV